MRAEEIAIISHELRNSLRVVRNAVELHGGSVSAVSAGLGSGSEFIVLLPVLRARANAGTAG